ncbi:LLM class flavin-dependent oxidoreductase [Umezawaea sp.]|uniref:LLM class flavin-dependent oxidoreductase n=1 Tax=Umezawaea sp. TaxID=1955258 RepID=UPI002ED0D09C
MSRLRDVPLSVLDLATIGSGSNATAALRDTTELARHVEGLGYHRFWLAEHHGMPGIASSAPAVLIGHVAAATARLRVGSGGVMLPNHAPLVVAEQFGTLAALHPDRIDLGIGRAPGTDQKTARALRRSTGTLSAEDFPQQLTELMGYFDGTEAVTAVPSPGTRPPVWLLGSSGYSAQVAGLLGLPFAFAHHFSAENTLPALALYRQNFRPSAVLSEPYAMVCAAVIAADTTEHARWIAGPSGLAFLRLRGGNPGLFPSPEEAAEHPYSDVERMFIEDRASSMIIGDPATVDAELAELLDDTRADELMVSTMVHSNADRMRSYELVAELAGRSVSV